MFRAQIAEWDEPDSDLDDDDDLLHLEDETNDQETTETKESWMGALLNTSVGSFLHGLTGTKV